ncbi:hypothetical protein K440DRAFT_620707 [Wilcoxina mikolae CBS 423.85]|nr:hypothetical protein K440DRAFT_620707 [Wilcoxina mikolae CBS 423.85]
MFFLLPCFRLLTSPPLFSGLPPVPIFLPFPSAGPCSRVARYAPSLYIAASLPWFVRSTSPRLLLKKRSTTCAPTTTATEGPSGSAGGWWRKV